MNDNDWKVPDVVWNRMAANRDKYQPLITRVVGFYIMCGALQGDAQFPILAKEVEEKVPGWRELSTHEMYFVECGAMQTMSQIDTFGTVSQLVGVWFDTGAPE